MVATLVRLKLTLLNRRFTTGGGGAIAGAVFGLIITAFLTFGAVAALLAARGASAHDAQPWVITGLVSFTVGWVTLPLLFFGTDNTLDPRRFALLPLRARQLQPGLFVSGLIGLPGVALVLIALAQAITWTRNPASVAIGIVSVPLGIATCFLLSRVVTAGFSDALSSRRARDVTAVVLGLFALLFGLANQLISAAAQQDPDKFADAAHRAGDIAAWTPLGWVWAAPADAARGHVLRAVAELALAAALVALLWWGWGRLLTRALETTGKEVGGGAVRSRGVLDRLTGSSATGAVMGRCLRYWRRDPRYLTALAGVVVAPILMCFSLRSSGAGVFAAPVFMAAMIGPTLLTDLAYDNSAFWLHVVSPMSMRADRAGRALALGVVVTPLLLVTILALAALTGRWDAVPWCIALCVCAVGAAMGVSLYQGARTPGKAPEPGGSAFGRGSSGGAEVFVALLGCWAATALLCAPVIVLAVLGLGWVALPVAAIIAGATVTFGIRRGAQQMEQTLPELLAKIST